VRKIFPLGIIVIALGLAGCPMNTAGPAPSTTSPGSGTAVHVYIAGTVASSLSGFQSNTGDEPVYWKDGVLTPLLSNGNTWGVAGDITTDKSGNVYVLGWQSGNGGCNQGVWKNGQFTAAAPCGSSVMNFTNIAVDSSGNVWLLGNTNGTAFVYQEGAAGTQTTLGGSPNNAYGLQADASGHAYYIGTKNAVVAGQNGGNPDAVGVYWQNGTGTGTPLALSGGNTFAYPEESTVDSSGNVYISGEQWVDTGSATGQGPVYWKTPTGIATPFNSGSYGGNWNAAGIAVDSSGNVHLVAAVGPSNPAEQYLLYWNSAANAPAQMTLPGGKTLFSFIGGNAALDSNGNFIVAGQVGSAWAGTAGQSPLSDGVPVYWQNTTPNLLPMGTGNTWGFARSVAVGP